MVLLASFTVSEWSNYFLAASLVIGVAISGAILMLSVRSRCALSVAGSVRGGGAYGAVD
jgi:hypothetical protein